MAGIESSGFAPWVQTAHLRFVSIARSIPPRLAHPPPEFMLEMRKLEEDDESRFEKEFNVWLSDEPLTNDEICQLMRTVERERKLEGKPRWCSFSPGASARRKHLKKPKESTPAAN